MKKLIVLGIMGACILAMYQFPRIMLNPGPLAKDHQEVRDKCLACHKPFWGIANDKCISCHKLNEIGHDSLKFHESLGSQECSSCHTDHKGLNADLTINFDHNILTASVLNNCSGCHARPLDQLHKMFGSDCSKCHSTSDWRTGIQFDHSILTEANRNNCSSCHQRPTDEFHQQVKDNCAKCHTTNQWKPSSFNHDQYFVLNRHHNAKCNTCHTSNNFTAYTCYGCHEHSEPEMRAKHNEEGIYNFSNCVSCHRSGDEHDIRMNDEQRKEVKDYIRSGKERRKDHDDD